MHAIHPDPRVVLAALVALLLVLVALATAPTLSDVELGGGAQAVAPSEPPAVKGPVPPPAWASDPFLPPSIMR
jgi:hypothetical protein